MSFGVIFGMAHAWYISSQAISGDLLNQDIERIGKAGLRVREPVGNPVDRLPKSTHRPGGQRKGG